MELAPELSIVAMLLAAVAVAALVAPLCERGLLRVFYGRDEVLLVLVTFALFLILEDVTKLVWGVNPLYVSEPYMLFGTGGDRGRLWCLVGIESHAYRQAGTGRDP
jgi:branched-chain amino acid transport system permease protein